MRALDRAAIDVAGIPGLELMRRAGAAAYRLLRARWPQTRRIGIVCGPGNNGGDGWVIAELARRDGLRPIVIALGDHSRLGADAAAARAAALAAGVGVADAMSALNDVELVVDAVFGIGLARDVDAQYRAAIDAINDCATRGLPVLAVDIPSGLQADTGAILGVAVRATATITFIGLKQGLVTGLAADCVGELVFDALGTPAAIHHDIAPSAQRVTHASLKHLLPRRSRAAHKGQHGHVLIVGGAPGYAGAARLAAEAALRVGAGLVSAAVHPTCAAQLNGGRPEIMVHAVTGAQSLEPLLKRATVVAVGPGLAQLDWSAELFGAVCDAPLPLVVDADALNLLARDPQQRANWCLTPHPGEAARLLGLASTRDIAADRYAAAAALTARYGGVAVLKGAGSIVSGGTHVAVIAGGNPGMAGGGMGDVLTGVIAALLAQGLALDDAATLGAALHAAAGDMAAADGERGLLASDLFDPLRRLVN